MSMSGNSRPGCEEHCRSIGCPRSSVSRFHRPHTTFCFNIEQELVRVRDRFTIHRVVSDRIETLQRLSEVLATLED